MNFRLKLQQRSNHAGNGREKDGDMENKNESRIADLMYRLRKEAGLETFYSINVMFSSIYRGGQQYA